MSGRVPSGRPVFHFKLVPGGKAPAGMVRVVSSGEPFQLFIPGLDHLPPVNLPDYWIDRREVTNRDYQGFIDDGGYRRADLWREPFTKDGGPVAFAAAMALLVDVTGNPGLLRRGNRAGIRPGKTTSRSRA